MSSLPGDLETAKRGGFPRQRRRAKKATPYAAAAAAAVLLPSAAAVFSALRTSTNVALVGGEAVAVVVPKSRESGMKRKQKSLHYTNKHPNFSIFQSRALLLDTTLSTSALLLRWPEDKESIRARDFV